MSPIVNKLTLTAFAVSLPLLFGTARAELVGASDTASGGFSRAWFGGGIATMVPQGELDTFIDAGIGLEAAGVLSLDPTGTFGLRLGGGVQWYGGETTRHSLLPRVDVDVTTNHFVSSLMLGPQITLNSRGALRPYVHGSVGMSYFVTESSVSGSDNFDDFASTNNFDDLSFSIGAGGGVLVRVADNGRNPVFLELSGSKIWNDSVQYLREDSITDNPDGSISINPIESDADYMTFRIGVSVGAR